MSVAIAERGFNDPIESAKKFLQKLKEDSKFRELLEKSNQETIERSLKAEGFEFTKDHLNKALSGAGEEYLDNIFDEDEPDVKRHLKAPHGSPTI